MEFDVNACTSGVVFTGVPNVRFWEYINEGWVKLTLSPKQTLSWSTCSRDWEGYDFNHYRWTHEGSVVLCEHTHLATDCDGKFDRWHDYECPLADLHVRSLDPDIQGITEFEKTLLTPLWVERNYSQRDYSAERMGY